jgi:hypothetical protein
MRSACGGRPAPERIAGTTEHLAQNAGSGPRGRAARLADNRKATANVKDVYTVTFQSRRAEGFQRAKELIEEGIARMRTASQPTQAQPDVADQLGKVAALRDQGVLTEEEFAAQKAKLLG